MAAVLAFVPMSIALADGERRERRERRLRRRGFRNVLAATSSGGILVMLIGIVDGHGEFRFDTVTSTFLVTPERTRVEGRSSTASAIVGVAVGVVASA